MNGLSFCILSLSYLKAYFNSSHTLSLVYWAEVMVPSDVVDPLARLVLPSKVYDPNDHIYDLKSLKLVI